MSGQITSSDDGNNVPGDSGWEALGPFNLHVLNGTTVSATLQKRTSQGNWVNHPDSNATISAAYDKPVDAAPGSYWRIAVTTATGTWDWGVEYRSTGNN